jgi:hypothetical protein
MENHDEQSDAYVIVENTKESIDETTQTIQENNTVGENIINTDQPEHIQPTNSNPDHNLVHTQPTNNNTIDAIAPTQEEEKQNHTETNKQPIQEEVVTVPERSARQTILISSEKVEQIKLVIGDNINSIINIYTNTSNHINHVLYIFKILNDNAYKKINNTLNLSKRFLLYFKEVVAVYQRFSVDLHRSNTILTSCTQDTILSENINQMIEKSQESLAQRFISFSNILTTNIINKGPFERVKNLEIRLTKIFKDIGTALAAVEQKNEKIRKKYIAKVKPVFEAFRANYDNHIVIQQLLEKNEIYLLEVEIMNSTIKLYNRLFDFMRQYKSLMSNVKLLVLDFMEVLKHTVELYMGENSKIFSDHYINNESLKKFYDSLTEEHLRHTFNLDNLLTDNSIKDYFNDTLKALQTTLIKFSTSREITNFNLLNNDELFKLGKYASIEEFVDFILGFMPKSLDIAEKDSYKSSMVSHMFQIRRDPGMFSGWKFGYLAITLQESLLIFDERVTKKPVERFKLKKLAPRLTPDKKIPFKFEISEKKKYLGLFNTNSNCVIDALSKETLDEILAYIQKCQN